VGATGSVLLVLAACGKTSGLDTQTLDPSGGSGGAEVTAGTGGDGAASGSGGSPPAGGSGGAVGGSIAGGAGGSGGSGGSESSSGGAGKSAGGETSTAGSDAGGAGSAGGGSGGGSGAAPLEGTVLGRIQVSAGDHDRDHTIVSFEPPFENGEGRNLVLDDGQGNAIPLQVNPADGSFGFILPALGAGEQALFTIVEVAEPLGNGATIELIGEHLHIKTGESEVLRWTLVNDNPRNQGRPEDLRAGYIYPLYTPGGLNVTEDYPVDHPHNHGIWSAWVATTFRGHTVDFYNGFSLQGRVDLESMGTIWSGPVHAGLVANLVHTDITTTPSVDVLTDEWVVVVYKTHDGAAPYFVLDIVSTQETATSDPLVVEERHDGGFTIRGAESWNPDGWEVLTSEGHTRADADGQKARWCSQYGAIDDRVGGYAALDHPENFRHPQALRVFPTNPFVSYLPVTAASGGRFTIQVGEPYRSRHRVVSFDGDANASLLERLWDDYATPPTVQVLP
jgi:hypothetical protein